MFKGSFKTHRLSSSLKGAIKQLEQLIRYKSEMVENTKKEIAKYLKSKMIPRAQIRVEYIIREYNLVEAMEMIQMYCDLLYKKIGLIETKTELDPALSEAVCTVIWAAPHMQTEVSELKTVVSQLCNKYSKEFGSLCRSNKLETVNEKVMQKLSTQAPSKELVDKYLFNLTKQFNIEYQESTEPTVDTSSVYEEPTYDLYMFADNAKKDNPSRPYPQSKVDTYATYEDVVFDPNKEKSGKRDLPLPPVGVGIKQDLYTDNQEAEIKNKQTRETIYQLETELKDLYQSLS